MEAEFLQAQEVEERGAVYSVGSNQFGQLGLGDLESRSFFTVVKNGPCDTRGRGVRHVAAGNSLSFAVTEDHEVFVWGGAGTGPMGLNKSMEVRRCEIKTSEERSNDSEEGSDDSEERTRRVEYERFPPRFRNRHL